MFECYCVYYGELLLAGFQSIDTAADFLSRAELLGLCCLDMGLEQCEEPIRGGRLTSLEAYAILQFRGVLRSYHSNVDPATRWTLPSRATYYRQDLDKEEPAAPKTEIKSVPIPPAPAPVGQAPVPSPYRMWPWQQPATPAPAPPADPAATP